MTDARQEYASGGFGARLKAAREAMHLTQKEAATRLHLSPSIIDILESDNFEKAPPATFLRGYLRSYARLLNFNEEAIQAALTQAGLETPAPRTPVVPLLRGETMPMSDRHVQRISTYVIVGLFVFTGIWWGFHSSSLNNTKTLVRSTRPSPATPQQPVAPAITTTTNTPQPTAPAVVTQTAPAQPIVAQSSAPAPKPAAATPTSAPLQAPVTTATAPANPVATPPVQNAATTPGTTPLMATQPITNTGIPPVAPPVIPPYAAVPPVEAPQAVARADTETPKKRNRHHKQDSNVSGFAMALPEPGL